MKGDAPGPSVVHHRWVLGKRLGLYAAAGIPVALVTGGHVIGAAAALAFDGLLVLGSWLEARSLRKKVPVVERKMAPRLIVGIPNRITLSLHNQGPSPVRVAVRDDLPAGWVADPDELIVELPPWARREAAYSVVPPRRGSFSFGDLHLRLEGPTRLGALVARAGSAGAVRVYPNVLGPRRYELAARLGDLARLGFRSVRTAGGGGEFAHLREYVSGDPYRDLDWKATAKRHKPITRVLAQERAQNVLLCIDAGRMMAARLGAVSKLDHAIDAALLCAWVALRQGDRVGLCVFADEVTSFVPPGRGPGQYRRLLEAAHDVEPRLAFVDFRRLVEVVRVRLPRRSLVVVFTDLLDEDHAQPLVDSAALLRARHLPVCVTMRDEVVTALARAPAPLDEMVYQRAAAADLLIERELLKARLQKVGVGIVEAPAGSLSVATVNRYLEIKARRAL